MKKSIVLGEILYIISSYEKGRVKSTGIWSSKYYRTLKESLKMMNYILVLMKNSNDITMQELIPIIKFYEKNVHVIFPLCNLNLVRYVERTEKPILVKEELHSEKKREIILFMEKIVEKCSLLLVSKEKNYKQKIACLLRALHNLPKVFLDTNEETFFSIGIPPIEDDEALQYALSYIQTSEERLEI